MSAGHYLLVDKVHDSSISNFYVKIGNFFDTREDKTLNKRSTLIIFDLNGLQFSKKVVSMI